MTAPFELRARADRRFICSGYSLLVAEAHGSVTGQGTEGFYIENTRLEITRTVSDEGLRTRIRVENDAIGDDALSGPARFGLGINLAADFADIQEADSGKRIQTAVRVERSPGVAWTGGALVVPLTPVPGRPVTLELCAMAQLDPVQPERRARLLTERAASIGAIEPALLDEAPSLTSTKLRWPRPGRPLSRTWLRCRSACAPGGPTGRPGPARHRAPPQPARRDVAVTALHGQLRVLRQPAAGVNGVSVGRRARVDLESPIRQRLQSQKGT